MNFLEELKKREETGRTTARQTVKVHKQGDDTFEDIATKCQNEEVSFFVAAELAPSDIEYRLCVVNDVKHLGETKPNAKGDVYDRYQLIGRDEGTNQTLFTWIILPKGSVAPVKATLMEFPCFKLNKGEVVYSNGTFVEGLKDCYQAAGQGMAEELNQARQAAYQMAVSNNVAAEKAAKVAMP